MWRTFVFMPAEPKSHVENRTWDLGYHQALDIIKTLDESDSQQEYDESAGRAKEKVFGSLAKCFLSGKPVGGVGDHICPMRGNRWKTCCLGSNTPWNLAPVVSALNQPYKNIVVFVRPKKQLKKIKNPLNHFKLFSEFLNKENSKQ